MTVVNDLPAHVLFVHFVVVLAPLTAVLEIVCGLWSAARRGQLVWLTLALAVVTAVLTPLTTHSGEWLYDLRANPDPMLREHAERGDTMLYFSFGLLVVAVGLVGLRLAERRGRQLGTAVTAAVAALAVLVGMSSIVQIYRIGDSGAQAVWGNELAHLQQARDR